MDILILVALSIASRLAYFGHPAQVVFDEVHIGDYISNYWHGTYFFDVHPPLIKLLIAGLGYLTGGYNMATDWTNIGNPLPFSLVILRLLPTILGIALPIIIYFICKKIGLSKTASFLAGILVIFENSLLVQSRFLLPDIFLIFFGFLSLLAYLFWRQQTTEVTPRYRGVTSVVLVLSAILSGLAFSIKWTGLAYPAIIIGLEAYRLWRQNLHTPKIFIKKLSVLLFLFASICFAIYVCLFAIHLHLLPNSGEGDAFMSETFQATLKGSPYASTEISGTSPDFWSKFTELNKKMFHASATLTTPHAYSSKWYSWPFMARSIYYWQGSYDPAKQIGSYIYLLGNPLIYYLALIAILVLAAKCLWGKGSFRRFFILGGYLINFLPFIFIGRVMFLYHYEAALLFGILAISEMVDSISSKKKMTVAIAIGIAAFIIFLYFTPLSYGLPLSDHSLAAHMWLSGWR